MKTYKEFIKENSEFICDGDFIVTNDMIMNGELIKEKISNIVMGNFICEHYDLISLKNCPTKIEGDFILTGNDISNLKYFPEKCMGDIYLDYNNLTSLEFCPKQFMGDFICNDNELTSLKFGPEYVKGDINFSYNKLSSLEFAPKKVGKDVIVEENINDLSIEAEFVKQGYTNYYPDLLRYCMDNKIDINDIKSWPENFLTDDIIKSVKGISKFGL